MLPAWRCKPAELFFSKHFAINPPDMLADDHCVEFPPVEALKQVARGSNPNFNQQLRILCVHACDQRGELRSGNMVANTDREPLPSACKYGERTIMYLQKFAGMLKEGFSPRRKLHVPGGPLDEPTAEPIFEPFQLQADGSLRCPHGFGRAREACKLGYTDESEDCIQVKGTLYHFNMLSLI